MIHTPVLLEEAVEALEVKAGGKYIDATFGEGGHLREIIKRGGRVLGIDADKNQIRNSKFEIRNEKNLVLVHGNFADIEEIVRKNDFYPVDGVLFDLGLSMKQLAESGKGFSYKQPDEPLDMRLSEETQTTAKEIINSYTEDELYEIFAMYSEELNSRAVARALVSARVIKRIETVGDLTTCIDSAVKEKDRHVYMRIFQALRIAVNNEFENLEKGLQGAVNVLEKNGRIVVISFHSGEDRIIKKFIKTHRLTQVNKKVYKSKSNLKFERSAKMRVIRY